MSALRGVVLDPFVLQRSLGAGGMARVVEAVHRGSGTRVAVKVLTAERASQQRYRDGLETEVRAMAGLQHPGIVQVLGYGRVDKGSGDEVFAPGSPWFAMELADRDLAHLDEPLSWPDLRALLLVLLDALAHAHARGIVHRDVKPSNVLLFEADGGLSPQLADFGIASRLDDGPGGLLRAGSVSYMAPEQILGQWHAQGPWTDLYALACLAWELATGLPPFERSGSSVDAHLTQPPPRFEPRIDVPPGLERWLRRLLVKDPTRRVAWAADATFALQALGEPTRTARAPAPGALRSATTTLVTSVRPASTLVNRTAEVGTPAVSPATKDEEPAGLQMGAAPWSVSWRRPPARHSPHLLGTGLGLYGLRRLPLVGREAARGAMWEALGETSRTGRARGVLLTGPSGVGKSHLAEWLVERAHETGAAFGLRASHRRGRESEDALGEMVLRALRCRGLDAGGLRAHLGRELARCGTPPADLAARVTAWIRPEPDAQVLVDTEAERLAVAADLLVHLARDRAVVVWLDDVQWGPAALRLWLDMLRRSDAAVLFVATVQEDAVEIRPDARSALETLVHHDAVRRIEVGPLPPSERVTLVRSMLELEEQLARVVDERTQGFPLFAVQLVADWVERGVLALGEDGLAAREDEVLELPDRLHDLWEARVERLLAGRPSADRHALELAAVLGTSVDAEEWKAACAIGGMEPTEDLVPELVRRRLGLTDETGWSFVHGMLAESLQRMARESGRLEDWHRICAEMLDQRVVPTWMERQGRPYERIARHRVGAGDRPGALLPLIFAIYAGIHSHLEETAKLARMWSDIADRAGLSESDPLRVEYWHALGELRVSQGDLDGAAALFLKMIASGRSHGRVSHEALGLGLLANALQIQGRLHDARALARGAVWSSVEADYWVGEHWGRGRLGVVECELGHVDEAERLLRSDLEVCGARRPHWAISRRLNLSLVELSRGDADAATAWLDDAASRPEAQFPDRFEQAEMAVQRGRVARLAGDLAGAEESLRLAAERFAAGGSAIQRLATALRALVVVQRGEYAAARKALAGALEGAGAIFQIRTMALAGLLACAAGLGDAEAWARRRAELDGLLEASGLVHPEVEWMRALAGSLAAGNGWP